MPNETLQEPIVTLSSDQLQAIISAAITEDRVTRSWLTKVQRQLLSNWKPLLVGFFIGAAVTFAVAERENVVDYVPITTIAKADAAIDREIANLPVADRETMKEVLDDTVRQNFQTGSEYREYLRYQLQREKFTKNFNPPAAFAEAAASYLTKQAPTGDTVATVEALRKFREKF